MSIQLKKNKKYNVWVWILSILIPVVVAILFSVRIPGVEPLTFLPPIYATINAFTAVILVVSVIQIKKGNRVGHERLMKIAILLSCLFLILYMAYHMTSDPTPFGGEGMIRTIYYFLLISHIILSIGVVPLVLITFIRGLTGDFNRHKKIARITFPLWLYVAVSGVLVYVLIAPYY